MAARGPKPADYKLKLIRGERKDRRPKGRAPRAAGLPAAPKWLGKVARAEWARIVPELAAAGLLAKVDGAALTLYCVAYARWRAALVELGATVVGQTAAGNGKVHPAVAVATQAEAQMARLLAEFGATPASRSRVVVDAPPPADEFAEFMGRRKA